MRLFQSRLGTILALCGVLLLGACSVVQITPQSLLYQDEAVQPLDINRLSASIANSNAQLKPVMLLTADNLTLNGIVMLNPNARANVVLYPANGMTLNKSSALLGNYAHLPVNLLWFDYRGTGASQKSATIDMALLRRDAVAMFDYGKATLPSNIPLIVNGISMGSLLAPYVAQHHSVSGIVLDSAIDDMPKLASKLIDQTNPLVTVEMTAEMKSINNKTVLAQLEQPLLLLVGAEDNLTPPAVSKLLYNSSAAHLKLLEIIPDIDHNEPMTTPIAKQRYSEFIQQLSNND